MCEVLDVELEFGVGEVCCYSRLSTSQCIFMEGPT